MPGPHDNWRTQGWPGLPMGPGFPNNEPAKPNYPWQNPGQTIPSPWPANVPVPVWVQPPNPLVWANGAGAVIRTASWTSPMFDLRPDLRGIGERVNDAQAIWRAGGGHLYVIVTGLVDTATALLDLEVQVLERAHPTDSNTATGITTSALQDVTSEFTDGRTAALLVLTPPGAGYPVRFWRVVIAFNVLSAHADPPFSVAAGYY